MRIVFPREIWDTISCKRKPQEKKGDLIMDQIGEGIRKLILAGIGAAAMTKEKSEGILQELVKKGELTVEQGKVLNEELKHDLKQAIRENVTVNVVRPQAEDVMQAVEHMDDDALEALKQKIAQAQAARNPQESAEETATEPSEEPAEEDRA